MRIDSNYLKRFVRFSGNAAELAEWLTSIGIEIENFHGTDRSVLEFEITPNRPDWLCHYGVAREVAAKQRDLEFVPFALPEVPASQDFPFRLVIENPVDCGRYTGALVRNVKVKESPQWMKDLIERLGMRPINNIVDISNLAMLTCGHPIHIFDQKNIQENEIRIRRAFQGEALTLLDGKNLNLSGDHLVIADGKRPLALAGIMGGLNSGVTTCTRDIFIESAYFHPPLIRRSARNLGLKTDASYRFERGMDIENTLTALRLVLMWLIEDQGGKIEATYFQDLYPIGFTPSVIELKKDYPSAFTGVEIASATSSEILSKLAFSLEDRGDRWLVKVPSHRGDVSGKEDLVEEIIRIHGYDHLSSTLPPVAGKAVEVNAERALERAIGQHLVGLGFHEVINYVFQAPEDNAPFEGKGKCLSLKNPLGQDFSQMKVSLLPGLLKNCAFNLDQNQKRIMLFEIGKTFFRESGPIEGTRLALCVAGEYMGRDWHNAGIAFDFYLFRSLIENLFRRMRWPAEWVEATHPFFDPDCCFSFHVDGYPIGRCGRVADAEVALRGIEIPVFAADFDLERLRESVGRRVFHMWNRFPASMRDFSFLMEKTVTFERIRQTLEEVKPSELESYLLVDVFEGSKLPAGKVSLSLSFYYRGAEKTLTTEETNEIHLRLTDELKLRLALVQR